MAKDINLSKWDTTTLFEITQVTPIVVEVDTSTTNVVVTYSNGSVVNAGRYGGAVGNEVESLLWDNNNLVQENSNNTVNTWNNIKQDIIAERIISSSSFPAIFSKVRNLADRRWMEKRIEDTEIYTDVDSIEYRYVIPANLAWGTSSNSDYTTQEGFRVRSDSLFSSQYSLIKAFNRTINNSTDCFRWSAQSTNKFIIIDLPQVEKINGYQFVNPLGSISCYRFEIYYSVDGFTYKLYDTYDYDLAQLTIPVYRILPEILAKSFKIIPLVTAGDGAIGIFNLLSLASHELTTKLDLFHVPLKADPRFFTVTENSSSVTFSKKSNAEIATNFNPYTTGYASWFNYFRAEEVLEEPTSGPITSTGYTTRRLNKLVNNNLGATWTQPSIRLEPGEYYVHATTSILRGGATALRLYNLNSLQEVIVGMAQYGLPSVSNSYTSPVLSGIFRLTETSTLQLQDYVSSVSSTSSGIGPSITASNEQNVFAVLEIWKIRDITDWGSGALDPHWNNVILLLNGTSGWNDSSKYANPIRNENKMKLVDGQYAKAYSSPDASVRSLYTSYDSLYTLSNLDFTIECSIRIDSTEAVAKAIMSDDRWNRSGAWVIRVELNGRLSFWPSSIVGTQVETPAAIPLNTWTHVAVTRAGNTFRLFIDGQLVSTNTSSAVLSAGTQVCIGQTSAHRNSCYTSIENIRITKGVARYTSNYTVYNGIFTKDTI